MIIEQSLADCFNISEGINLVKADDEGKVIEEHSVRDDARRRTACRVDLSDLELLIQPSGERKTRMDNIADENEAATMFAAVLSKETGRTIHAEPKVKEDYRFPDIWLR